MARTDFSSADCSVARGLTEVGDVWSFLIIREAMFGVRRYSDFQRKLDIAKNILRDRLNTLVENGILDKVNVGEYGTRFEYVLTEKGRDLLPIVITIRQWADKWIEPEKRNILVVKDAENNQPLPRIEVRNRKGKPLGLEDITASMPR
ncbi:MAG: helix-turn-helix domain-containing protein [Pseudomonadota bacterium]